MVDGGTSDLAQHVHPGHQIEALSPTSVKASLSSGWRLEDDTVKILCEGFHALGDMNSADIINNSLDNVITPNTKVLPKLIVILPLLLDP